MSGSDAKRPWYGKGSRAAEGSHRLDQWLRDHPVIGIPAAILGILIIIVAGVWYVL